MKVLVFGTGRCGSTTFHQACRHMTNYTTSHEKYLYNTPDDHINVNCRLTWVLPDLPSRTDNDTFFVHLVRRREEVVNSWLKRGNSRGFGFFKKLACPGWSDAEAAGLCYTVMSKACSGFIIDRNCEVPDGARGGITFMLDDYETHFEVFWNYLDAQGDYDAALATFQKRFNAS